MYAHVTYIQCTRYGVRCTCNFVQAPLLCNSDNDECICAKSSLDSIYNMNNRTVFALSVARMTYMYMYMYTYMYMHVYLRDMCTKVTGVTSKDFAVFLRF